MGTASKLVRVIEEGRFTERLLRQFTPKAVRNLKRPSIGEVLNCSHSHWRAEDFLDAILPNWDRKYAQEFEDLQAEIIKRYESHALTAPLEGNLQSQTGLALYVWIRTVKPKTILETGIANGHSTAILLNAVMRNGSGEVHSIDIRPDVGGLLTIIERKLSHFEILPSLGSSKAFRAIVDRLAPLDLFIHDSQHSYDWQMAEYRTAWPKVKGLLASDDADGNFAFWDFAASLGIKPHALFESNKVTGFIVSPES